MLNIKKSFLNKQNKALHIKKENDDSSAVFFYNFSHAENEEIFNLKKILKEFECYFVVCKNTIFKKSINRDDLNIKGNNAFIFYKGKDNDVMYKFLKTLNNFTFKQNIKDRIRGGIYDEKFFNSDEIIKWSKLNSREFIINDLCNSLLFNINKLVMFLDQIKNKKE